MVQLPKDEQLLCNIKKNLPELEELLQLILSEHTYEDLIYRYYHQSFKVYWIQGITEKITDKLKSMAPEDVVFNSFFEKIFKAGTGKTFKMEDNKNWEEITGPLLTAFFHAKYFLEMACKYGKTLELAPSCLQSGWAGFLYLYNLR